MFIVRSFRAVAGLLVAVAFALVATVPALAATPATLRTVDLGAPSLGQPIPIAGPSGGTFTADPGRAAILLTRPGGAVSPLSAWCVQATVAIEGGGDYSVILQTSADAPELANPGYQAAGWLIGQADGLIAAASSPSREAAAIQLAIWQLTGQAADIASVTGDSALNRRVVELRGLAAGKTLATSVAVSAPAGEATVGVPTTLTVAGTPGATVDVVVYLGTATLSSGKVTLGVDGSGTVTVTPTVAGALTVRASAQAAFLERAISVPGAPPHQALAFVTPTTVTATATITASTPAPSAPSVNVPVVSNSAASIAVVKVAPPKARRGAILDYVLTITNTSAQPALGVVVRDPLPKGTFLAIRPANAKVRSSAVVWQLGTIAPGKSVTLRLKLGTSTAPLGALVNVASAFAANAATVQARAVTRLTAGPRAVPAVVAPRVTG